MKSIIVSEIVSISKGISVKFRESKLGSAIENIYRAAGRSWKNAVTVNVMKKNAENAGGYVKKITGLPFDFLEFVNVKFGKKISDTVSKSVLCESARRFVHNFMALNTRFWGAMLFSAAVFYNIFKFAECGFVNRYVAAATVIFVTMMFFNADVTGYFESSKLVDFVKACMGFKNLSFEFWDKSKTHGALRIACAAAVGAVTGAVMSVSPLPGLLIPFAVFGMLLVLQYPSSGVFAAVFTAPLIPFSSLPLVGICIWTMISLIIKSVSDSGFRWKRNGTGAALMLFLAVLLVSCIFSFARSASLTVWVMYFVLVNFYFAVINTMDTREKIYALLRVFVISGVLVAVYGVMQYAFGWTTTNAWIDEEMFEEETMRVYSTLGNPNVLGEFLLLVLPVAVVFFLKDKTKSLSKWCFLGISGIVFLCLILTQSRGCWLGFMLAAALFVTFYEGRWWAFVPLVLCALPFVLPDSIIERLLSIGDMGDSSTSYRVFIWMGAMGIVRNYFMGGIGMGEAAFSEVYPLFSYNAIIAPHSHNTYLQLLVEGGIPALGMFLAVLAVFFKGTHSGYVCGEKKSEDSAMLLGLASGITGFLLQSMFDYTFYNYRVMGIFFMLMGITAALAYAAKEEKSEIQNN